MFDTTKIRLCFAVAGGSYGMDESITQDDTTPIVVVIPGLTSDSVSPVCFLLPRLIVVFLERYAYRDS